MLLGALLALITAAASTRGTDYFYYYCVSKLIALGHAGQIYNLQALGQVERALIAPLRVPHGVIPNVYPPFFAAAFVPLAELPYSAGYAVWLAINCVLLGVSLSVLERYAGLGFRGRIVFRAAAFCSLPVIIALLQGQVSMILLACLIGAFVALRAGKEVPAGLALSALLIKPQLALPFLLLLLLQRRRRALAAFAGAGVALVLAPLPVLGWDASIHYLSALRAAAGWGSQVGGFAPEVNRSFAGFAALLLPAQLATVVGAAVSVVALGVLAWVCVTSPRESVDIPFALAVVVALLASQHVLIHDLSLLLIPEAVVVRRMSRWAGGASAPEARGRSAGQHRAEALDYDPGDGGVWLVLVGSYLAIPVGFWLSRVAPVQLPTLAMAALGLWLVAWHRRETSESAGGQEAVATP